MSDTTIYRFAQSAAVWLALKRWVTGRDLKGGEEIDDPVPPIVVRVPHGAASPYCERPLGTLQGLDGRLLVDTEHNRVFGRVEVQVDDISDLGRGAGS